MGEIIELRKELLIPSQGYLDATTFREIASGYKQSGGKTIVPVRADIIPGKFVLLDGHHRCCYFDILNMFSKHSLYGWIVENKTDFIRDLPDDFYNENLGSQNETIEIKWFSAGSVLDGKFPGSISELRGRYKELGSLEEFNKFVSYTGKWELTDVSETFI